MIHKTSSIFKNMLNFVFDLFATYLFIFYILIRSVYCINFIMFHRSESVWKPPQSILIRFNEKKKKLFVDCLIHAHNNILQTHKRFYEWEIFTTQKHETNVKIWYSKYNSYFTLHVFMHIRINKLLFMYPWKKVYISII